MARQLHIAVFELVVRFGMSEEPSVRQGIILVTLKEREMNWDQIEGNWKKVRGKAQETWGKLTDDDLDVVEGKRDQLAGKIQERYGVAKEEAERQVEAFAEDCNC
jgi:uncharacterized protein YjbJ (UPF0337 family)